MVKKSELLDRIEKLENTIQQLTETTIEHKRVSGYGYSGYMQRRPVFEITHVPTIKSDVEAIKDYLGITVDYIPEVVKTNTTPAEIKAVELKKSAPKNVKTTKKAK